MLCPACGGSNLDGTQVCGQCGRPLPVAGWAEATPVMPAHAGFWRRLFAGLIDGVFLLALGQGFLRALRLLELALHLDLGRQVVLPPIRFLAVTCPAVAISALQLIVWPLGVAALWLYYALMESSARQGTPGKLAVGIAVTRLDGRRISFGRASARHWAKAISILTLGIGFLMAGSKEKRTLHDRLAGCQVVRE